MPRFGLRGVIFVPLLLLLSTNPPFVAAEGLQTNETKPELLPQADEELESWKEKSATIIHHLPGALLTTSRRGKFTMKFLNHLETKTMKNEIKETIRTTKFGKYLNLPKIKAMKNKIQEMVRTKKLGRLCKLLNHLMLRVSNRIARANLKRMKHKMVKQRMRGLLLRMFLRVNVPSIYKEGLNRRIKALNRRCFNQTRKLTMAIEAKKDSNMITI